MIQKDFVTTDGRAIARVTFTLPDSLWAEQVYLVGDFNDWQRTATPLSRTHSGEWVGTVDLEIGRAYQFRYLCDNAHWINDSHGDAYVTNPYGSENFVVVTDPAFRRYSGEGQ